MGLMPMLLIHMGSGDQSCCCAFPFHHLHGLWWSRWSCLWTVAIVVLVVMWALVNWQWNTNKQYKISMARGKRVEALCLWRKITKPRGKDVFFETKYGRKRLVVLHNGNIKSYRSHKIETLDREGG